MGTAQWRTHRQRFNRSLAWDNLFYLAIKKVYDKIFYTMHIKIPKLIEAAFVRFGWMEYQK